MDDAMENAPALLLRLSNFHSQHCQHLDVSSYLLQIRSFTDIRKEIGATHSAHGLRAMKMKSK
jgi:hypothetical protein